MRRLFRPLTWLSILLLIAGISISTMTSARAATRLPLVSTNITIDGHGSGRIFDGVGGLSGGGGTSRLLIDYPAQQQQQILDYLFKPGYGASLQILKVEIGSDTDTTEGAEPSSQRTPTDQNFNRGYEWWLMQQAKARNPNIKLYALEWGAPGWFQASPDIDPNNNFWSHDNINYIINWLKHAQSDHNLHIDYIGGWNERGYNKTWYEDLKSALQSNGLNTQVVGDDSFGWGVATAMKNDSSFNNSIDIVGQHYPCGYMSSFTTCNSSSDAISLNKPLWASENGSENYDGGAPAVARALNRDYIDGRMTAYINWSLVYAWYSTLPFAGDGLLQADQPWSGHYYVAKSVWAMAHTAQFTQPGWQYIDSASSYLGGSNSNGSYVSLKSPNGSDYSTIIETMDASAAQIANFQVTNGLSTGTVHVWATNLNSSNSSDWFVHQQDITPNNGAFSLTLQPGYIYSLTTTTGQGKGTAAAPASASWNLPYSDNFESYSAGQIPHYFSTLNGAYETAPCGGGRSGMCMRQVINIAPITWMNGPDPFTVIGDPNWSNYQASIDALLEQSGYVDLIGGMNNQNNNHVDGYHLHFTDSGSWTLFKEDTSGNTTTLASGTTTFGLNTWHHLTLNVQPGAVVASIDNTQLASVNDSSYPVGQVGLQVSPWINAQFDNFSVTPLASTITTVDDSVQGSGTNQFNYSGNWQHCSACGSDLYNGTNSWDNTTNDTVTVNFTGTRIRFYGVVDPRHGIGAVSIDGGSETNIDFYAATRAGDQLLWTSPILAPGNHTFKLRVTGTKNASSSDYFVVPDRVDISGPPSLNGSAYYELINRNSGQVLDVSGASTADGAAVIQWPWHSGTNQEWQFVSTGDGYFKIVNRNSGKVLDVANGSTADGGTVDQWTDNGGSNQQWSLVASAPGYYQIVNRNSGKVLDVLNASSSNGATVAQWTDNGGNNQQWSLVQV